MFTELVREVRDVMYPYIKNAYENFDRDFSSITTARDEAVEAKDKAQEYKELSFGSAYQAELSNQNALRYRNETENFKTEAVEARDKAEKWANEAENIEVESGLFSAYHWSQRAKAIVNGSADGISVVDVVNESGDIIVKDNVQASLANISSTIDEQTAALGNEIWINAQNIQKLKLI